jgi:hypothetical protein
MAEEYVRVKKVDRKFFHLTSEVDIPSKFQTLLGLKRPGESINIKKSEITYL